MPSAEVVALVEEAGAREAAATVSGGTDPHRTSATVATVVSAVTEAIVRSGTTEAAHVTGILASEAGMARETAMNEAVRAMVSAVRSAPATITATAPATRTATVAETTIGIATVTAIGIGIGIGTIVDLGPLALIPAVASAEAATRATAAGKADSTIVVTVGPGTGATRPRG